MNALRTPALKGGGHVSDNQFAVKRWRGRDTLTLAGMPVIGSTAKPHDLAARLNAVGQWMGDGGLSIPPQPKPALDFSPNRWEAWCEHHAYPNQIPPPGNWRSWNIPGGRQSGRTRAAVEYLAHLTSEHMINVALIVGSDRIYSQHIKSMMGDVFGPDDIAFNHDRRSARFTNGRIHGKNGGFHVATVDRLDQLQSLRHDILWIDHVGDPRHEQRARLNQIYLDAPQSIISDGYR